MFIIPKCTLPPEQWKWAFFLIHLDSVSFFYSIIKTSSFHCQSHFLQDRCFWEKWLRKWSGWLLFICSCLPNIFFHELSLPYLKLNKIQFVSANCFWSIITITTEVIFLFCTFFYFLFNLLFWLFLQSRLGQKPGSFLKWFSIKDSKTVHFSFLIFRNSTFSTDIDEGRSF